MLIMIAHRQADRQTDRHAHARTHARAHTHTHTTRARFMTFKTTPTDHTVENLLLGTNAELQTHSDPNCQ